MKLIPNLTAIDRKAIDDVGIPGLELMETAGRFVMDAVIDTCENNHNARVVILCGYGNNGGDGFVCARLLAKQGWDNISVCHLANAEQLRGDALANFQRLSETSINTILIDDMREIIPLLEQADVIVDGLFGSGLSRPIEGLAKQLIHHTNLVVSEHNKPVIAIDLPSGVDSASGQIIGEAILATQTITFASPKPGLYLYPGKDHPGDVSIVDIGIPSHLIDEDTSHFRLMTPEVIRNCIPKRKPDGHKKSFGHVLAIGSCRDMPGAIQLTAEAALTSGCGLVTVATPETVLKRNPLMPELLQHRLMETSNGTIRDDAFEQLESTLEDFQAIVIGPGMGTDKATVTFLEKLLNTLIKRKIPTVIDADGINGLSLLIQQGNLKLEYLTEQFVLTPHVGEFLRLTELPKSLIENEFLLALQAAKDKTAAHIVLKSAVTAVGLPDKTIWVSPCGNSGMATAGSGDVLAGIIGSLAAQSLTAHQSLSSLVLAGVYLHGLAGDIATSHRTVYAVRASDITHYLPDAFKHILTL